MITLALGLAAASAGAPATVVDRKELERLSAPTSIRTAFLAPDGRLLYVLDAERRLNVYDTATMKPRVTPIDWPRTTFTFFPTSVPGVLATLDVSGGPHIVLRQVVPRAPEKDKTIALPGRVAGFAKPAGQAVRVLTQGADGTWAVNAIDAKTGAVETTSLPPFAQDFAFAPGNRPVAALMAEDKARFWKPVRCGKPSCAPLRVDGSSDVEGVIDGLADGSGLNFWWRSAGLRVPAVWTWDGRGVRSLGQISGADVADTLVDPSSGRIQAFAGGVFEPRWQAIDSRVRSTIRELGARVRGYPQILDRSADDARWLVADITDEAPPLWSLYSARTKQLVPLPGQAKHDPMPRARGTWVTTRDGLRVPVYLSPPAASACDARRERCGLVALIHGGPQHRDERTYSQDVELIQKMGLWVLRVNYRGSTGFGTAFVERGNGEWGRKISYDVIDAIEWSTHQPGVDGRRVCAAGESFGGFTAINVASLRPDLIACAASLNGGGDLEQFATDVITHHPDLAPGLARQLGDVKTPDGLAAIRSQSPKGRIAALTMPLLLAYGTADDTTPPSQTTGLEKALDAAPGTHSVTLAYDKEQHVLSPAAQCSYRAALANFLARAIGARARVEFANADAQPEIRGDRLLIQPKPMQSAQP